MQRFTGLIGLVVLLAIGLALGRHRRAIRWRTIVNGLVLQFTLAWLLLRFPPVVAGFTAFASGVARVIRFADEGSVFVFGRMVDDSAAWGFIFAFKVLPIIVFFASLMAVLYRLGVMQRVVAVVAWVIRRTLGVTGTEALSAAANIFLGQTEAPLTVRPFIVGMTRSQIMCVMTCGFATIAAGVMMAYIAMVGGNDDALRTEVAKHFMTASVMSAVAGTVMSKLMLPETETVAPESLDALRAMPQTSVNVMDAAAQGATEGLQLALNVGAMLIAFVGLLALLNWPLSAISEWPSVAAWRDAHGLPVFKFENLLGYVFGPLAWTLGLGPDSRLVGSLMGQQIIATEFVAYVNLAAAVKSGAISARGEHIATYVLCGFANLPSIAIQIGGLSALAPTRRGDFASLGLRAMVAGALACWMTGAIAGIFL
jgi:CNT family concentrative nucleoside transporter